MGERRGGHSGVDRSYGGGWISLHGLYTRRCRSDNRAGGAPLAPFVIRDNHFFLQSKGLPALCSARDVFKRQVNTWNVVMYYNVYYNVL
jgi:hypothetical protein